MSHITIHEQPSYHCWVPCTTLQRIEQHGCNHVYHKFHLPMRITTAVGATATPNDPAAAIAAAAVSVMANTAHYHT